jgi:precorrin-2 dehydrogenase/sirohydrochlorin ferrochelatase
VSDNHLYIACIDLAEKRCLVVGAGPVGVEKVEGLLAAHARVTVVAPEGSPAMERLEDEGRIVWARRRYESPDLDGVFLVIAATSDTGTNESVHADAESRSLLVNVADVPHLCNFILPAVVRTGPVAVAISTNGASPALAQRMKREAAGMFDGSYARLAVLLEEVRPWAKGTLPAYGDRKAFFDDIVGSAPDPIELLRAGRDEEVKALIRDAQKRHAARFDTALTAT